MHVDRTLCHNLPETPPTQFMTSMADGDLVDKNANVLNKPDFGKYG